MAQGVDFLSMYREFHLEPGADIDDLKRAYRRRVSLVHPDRLDAKDAISQYLATEHLQRLTTLYEAGVQFHRRHGRLPGASGASGSHVDMEFETPEASLAPPKARRPRRLRWIILALVMVAALAWWLLPLEPTDQPVPAQPGPVANRSVPIVAASKPVAGREGIRVGASKDAVIRVHGAPVMREGERWLYGPSWILFEDGKVAEWYSSPLHPLRISREPAVRAD